MDMFGPAILGLAAVVVIGWIVGLRRRPGRKPRRTPKTSQTFGSDDGG